MELKEVDQLIRETPLELVDCLPYLKHVEAGSFNDVVGGHAQYYTYLAKMMKAFQPAQVVELGSAAGTSALMILSTLARDGWLYCLTLPEPEGEFRYIKDTYDNLTMIRGNSLDLSNWEIDLNNTDIWFFDTDHTYELLHAELELYDPYFKKGTLVLVDDIHLNEGMERAWDEIKYPKIELNDLHTYKNTGFGMFQKV